MYNTSNIKLVPFPLFEKEDSSLVVYECGKQVPFTIQRLFTIKSIKKSLRGFHAHKECFQLLIALQGECTVTCDDGASRKNIVLNKASEGLLLPPTIWAEQEYQPDTILLVLTSMPFDENDYLRDYNKFLEFRKSL